MFHRLYNISPQKEAWIAEMVGDQGQSYWNLQFTKSLFDWEKEQLATLHQLLSSLQLQDSREDGLQWNWSIDLTFSVKSPYSRWEDQRFLEDKELFSIWKNICPPKVELFAWMAMQNCIGSKSVQLEGES